MRRRDLIAMLGGAALAWPHWASAQAAPGLPLVAVLWPGRPEIEVDFDAAVRRGLKEGGFVEGTNFTFAMRYADGDFKNLAPLAVELAALKPTVIITATDGAVSAAHRAAPNVPLVTQSTFGDPVALGFAESYARPGGTVTGFTLNASGGEEALVRKRIGLLKEIVPTLGQLGLIVPADTPQSVVTQNAAADAASRLGFKVLPLAFRSLDDVEAAFASGLRAGADAFYLDGVPLIFTNRAKVAELAARTGKPTIGNTTEVARAGLLMAYGTDLQDLWRRTGGYAAKVLSGAHPGDLPIEQATKFTLAINLRTAKALGLTIPPTLLARADEVIE